MIRSFLKTLPLAGAEFVRICFGGNGKDSEASIEVRGAREATIPLSGAAMDLTFAGHDQTCMPQDDARNEIRNHGRHSRG
jgi:hypothetical protein